MFDTKKANYWKVQPFIGRYGKCSKHAKCDEKMTGLAFDICW